MLLVTVCCLALIHIYVQADCPIVDRDTYLHEQSRLYKNLLKDYDPRLPAVTMQAAYSSLNLLNASANLPKYEVLLTLVFMKMIRMAWRDERLKWNVSDYCGIEFIFLSINDIWVPEITVVGAHSSEDYREDYKKFIYVRFKPLEIIPSISRISGGREPGTTGRKFEVPAKWRPNFWNLKDRFVNSSGFAEFFVPTLTSTICSVEVQDFPFDHQECDIQIMSQSFSAWLYGINATLSPSLANNATAIAVMGNGEWQIKNVSVRSEFVDSGQEFPFQLSSFVIAMKRNSSFYITLVITPSFIINVLSIFGVFLRTADSMGKLGMALTNIMSVTFILGILATALPKTKELPKIAIYVMVNLCIMVFALTITLVLPYLDHFMTGGLRMKDDMTEKKRRKEDVIPKVTHITLFVLLEIANLINFIVLVV